MTRILLIVLSAVAMAGCSSVPQIPKSCDGYSKRPVNPEMQPAKTTSALGTERHPSC